MRRNQSYILFIAVFFIGFGIMGGFNALGGIAARYIYSNSKPDKPVRDGVVSPYDYQIELHNDTTWLYDGERLVGITIDSTYSGKGLYDLITADNE